MFRSLFGLSSQRPCRESKVVRLASPASGVLRMEVDGRKKATGRFTLFSNGQVLTGTLEGAPESLSRFVQVSLQVPPGAGRKLGGAVRAPLPLARSRYEACDH